MTKLTEQYQELTDWLLAICNQDVVDTLNGEFGDKVADNAICSFLDDIGEEGYIEVSGQFTRSGNPIINWFPDYEQ